MNPSSNEASGHSLPAPVNEQAPAFGVAPEVGLQAPEQAPRPAEKAAGIAQPAPALPVPLPTPMPINNAQTDVSGTSQTVVPDVKDDGDLIEKEWVNKAKMIVERNRDDPYKQSEELTVFKADYMKKRYDKTIKVSE